MPGKLPSVHLLGGGSTSHKNYGKLTSFLLYYYFCDYTLSLGLLYLL